MHTRRQCPCAFGSAPRQNTYNRAPLTAHTPQPNSPYRRSLHDIHMHMRHYVDPLQRFVMRLLWMVPIYSLQSWWALVWHEDAHYLITARECYEAYCL